MIGQTISRYKILERLGAGGMGEVYKAEDTTLGRAVALKFLAAPLLNDDEAKQRFLREAKAAAAISHPNICHVYEVGEEGGKTFLAMAFLEGESLEDRIAKGPAPLDDALQIGRQVAEGLEAAHEKGIVHRDIKPANIMVDSKGHATILDFGLARLTEASKLTRQDQTVGTAAYMSPEQLQGGEVDPRTDIWALGCVLYEMVAGARPFKGQYEQALAYEIVHESPEPLTGLRTGVPVELEVLINKAIAKDPGQRYQSAVEIGVDLRALETKPASGRSTARSRVAAPPAAAPSRTRERLLWLGALAAAVALTAWLLRPSSGSTPAVGGDYTLQQATFDSGLSFEPAISPDGQFIAYASDRAQTGDLDIWVRQLSGGQPIRLTNDPADDREPVISPDGSTVAFSSDREPPGVYVAPMLGGPARLVGPGGWRPFFNPDGSLIAYRVGSRTNVVLQKTFVVAPNQGEPRDLLPDGTSAAPLFFGPRPGELTAFSIPVDANFQVGDSQLLAIDIDTGERRVLDWTVQGSWSRGRRFGFVRFARAGSSQLLGTADDDIWSVPITERGFGRPIRLTFGPGREQDAGRATNGRLVFAAVERPPNTWALPVNARSGEPAGEPRRITDEPNGVLRGHTNAARGALAFETLRGPTQRLIGYRDLSTGEESLLTPVGFNIVPIVTPDGRAVIYSTRDAPGEFSVHQVNVREGSLRTICENCGFATAGNADLSKLYMSPPGGRVFDLLDAQTGERMEAFLKHPEQYVYDPQLSPDGRWIVFQATVDAVKRQIVVAPYQEERPIRPDEWIPITSDNDVVRAPRWPPVGDLVYFLADEGGYRSIHAQRLDPATKRPVGERFVVAEFRNSALTINTQTSARDGFVVTNDKVFITMREQKGNIWTLTPPED